jgi:hypothetical protein
LTGQNAFEQRQCSAQASGGHPHVVELFDVLSESGSGFVGEHGRQVAAHDGVGHVTDRGPGWEIRRAQIGYLGYAQSGRQQPDLELRQDGGLQTAIVAQLVDQRREHVHPPGIDFDLDAAHPHRVLVVAHHDDGVVEIDFSQDPVGGMEAVGVPARPHLEEMMQRRLTDQSPQAPAHGTVNPQAIEPVGLERFGHFYPSTKSRHGRGAVLERHLVLAVRMPYA